MKDLQEELIRLKAAITTNDYLRSFIREQIEFLNTRLDRLYDEVDTLEGQIEVIKDEIEEGT